MTIPTHAIQRLYFAGWLYHVPYGDLHKLTMSTTTAKEAMRRYSEFHCDAYQDLVTKHHRRAIPYYDGEYGPAMTDLLDQPRCNVPDQLPPADADLSGAPPDWVQVVERMRTIPAIGGGNWPRCHGVGDYHGVAVRVDDRLIGGHLKPVFSKVLENVQRAYAEFGLRIWWIDRDGRDMQTDERWDGRINVEFSFVSSSSGWAGLAIVGTNQSCSDNIWCRYLARYRGSNVEREWTTLIKHELGHNTGRGHTSGGVMNPYIVEGLPISVPSSDPSYRYWTRSFGGERVPIGDPDPDPNPKEGWRTVTTFEDDGQTYRVQRKTENGGEWGPV